jgi:putative tryptophan/tyrosine transport system substrate-binding protein
MRRREFITLVGGAAAARPLVAWAQQPAKPTIGFLNGTSLQAYGRSLLAFRRGLSETGYVEGRNVDVEYRWAEGHYERLPALAADLVRRQVTVIVATSTPANVIARAATTTIPIVFTTSSDPVGLGLVASLNRPGGNVTGAASMNVELDLKRLEMLHELVPGAITIAILVNPNRPGIQTQSAALEAAARTMGRQVVIVNAGSESELGAAFARIANQGAGALFVHTDAFLFSQRDQLIELAKRYGVPASFDRREFVELGGLMSYGGSVTDVYYLAGIYTGRILTGEKPADLPVQLSTKVELVINLKTAKALGLTIPTPLLARADEVIE